MSAWSKTFLPQPLLRPIDRAYSDLLQPAAGPQIDFTQPAGEAALVSPDSVSWRIFKNPVTLFIGGITAVLLEFGEPGVRTGVWEHSTFRKDPVTRLQRTGLAAMVTVYGARSTCEAMIVGVVRAHDRVSGTSPGGQSYHANDPDLLNWVQMTAMFGFAQAYSQYAHRLTRAELDRLCLEAKPAGRLYGATGMPGDEADREAKFEAMRDRLEPSPIVFEFLDIMHRTKAFPVPLRPLQALLICAAVSLVPDWIRERLGLTAQYGLQAFEKVLVQQAARLADGLLLPSSPPVQACRRMGLPDDYLYK